MHETGELVQVIGPFIDKLSLVFNCDESECQGQAYYIDSLVGKRDWLQLLPWNFRGPACTQLVHNSERSDGGEVPFAGFSREGTVSY